MTTAPPAPAMSKIPVGPAAPPAPTGKPPAPPVQTPPTHTPPPAAEKSKPRKVTTAKAEAILPKIVMYAGEKFGKTTLLAYAPKPLILMPGEQGYRTLLNAGRVPAVPAEAVNSWFEVNDWISQLSNDPQGIQTLGIDGIGALDRMCQEYVCKRDFDGIWKDPKDGALAWGGNKFYKLCAVEWARFLSSLEALRAKHGVIPILLGHASVGKTPNPMGADLQTYTCDCEPKTWAEIARWSDCILFGRFYTVLAEGQGAMKPNAKAKGVGGADRVLYTEGRDALIAGNRFGMEPAFTLPDDPNQMWTTVWNEIARDKSKT